MAGMAGVLGSAAFRGLEPSLPDRWSGDPVATQLVTVAPRGDDAEVGQEARGPGARCVLRGLFFSLHFKVTGYLGLRSRSVAHQVLDRIL